MGDQRDDAELQRRQAGAAEDPWGPFGESARDDEAAPDEEGTPDDEGTPDHEGTLSDEYAAQEGAAPGTHTALPPKIEAWRRRSAAGAILTGFALGLQEALETRKEEPSIVMETSGDPPRDLPVEADFEYGRPRQSVVQIRPWLLPEAASEQAPDTSAGPDSGGQEEGGER